MRKSACPAPTRPVRPAGPGFSPLDERLGLLRGTPFAPPLIEAAVQLGARLPFAQAAALLRRFTGVAMDHETVRRWTETAGSAAEALTDAAVATYYATYPASPAGPACQMLSVDGAMVPLVKGVWAEVRTLAMGTVTTGATGGPVTTELSYVSRLTDAATFGEVATVETHRRGTRAAGTVVAVGDGAAWIQGFVDGQCPDAVRILDVVHAVQHLAAVAHVQFGVGTAAASEWLGSQAHALRHGQEETVLTTLHALATTRTGEVAEVARQTHAYLASRRDQIRYAEFAAAGYPIGSGCVESANKLLVEARLKGAGMHWGRTAVTPMLELRTMVGNARWDERWPAIWRHLLTQTRHRPSRLAPTVVPAEPAPRPASPRPKLVVNGKPTADHPWNLDSPFPAKP